MKRQKNIRLSERTWEKIEWLAARYGTQTTAIEIAIDQLYEKEKNIMSKKSIVFYVDTDLDAYGEGATESTPDEYAEFARNYLERQGYDVEIETYQTFLPPHLDEQEREQQQILSAEIWQAYCNS